MVTIYSQVICGSCLLITDYSSVAFDFVLVGRPVVFYQFDLEDYRRAPAVGMFGRGRGSAVRRQTRGSADRYIRVPGCGGTSSRAEGFRAGLLSDYPYAGDA